MSIKIIIDNDDKWQPGGDWTATIYDSDLPELDDERAECGKTPLSALERLLSEYAL